MKIHGVKKIWSSPIFLYLKKHYCPACNSKLTPTKVSKIVNSKSEEAEKFDFSAGDVLMCGNIKFIWKELQCNSCCCTYSINDVKVFEKKAKKQNQCALVILPSLYALLNLSYTTKERSKRFVLFISLEKLNYLCYNEEKKGGAFNG